MKNTMTCAIIAFLLFADVGFAKVIAINSSDGYSKIESAQAGDIIEISPGTYRFRIFLDKHGTSQNPITIRAKDPNNRPVWDLSGQSCGDWPGSYTGGDLKRGAWQISGSYYDISGIIIKNSQTTTGSGIGDSSGVRIRGGHHITIRNSHFEGNDNGVSGFGEVILYEKCVFTKNGSNGMGDLAHNIYLHGGTQTFRYCKITDAAEGQNVHLRGKDFRFEYCWIENESTYIGDLMISSTDWAVTSSLDCTLTLIGCVIKGAMNPANDSKLFTMYNQPYRTNVKMTINMYYNTIIGNGNSAAVVRFTDSGLSTQTARLYNNIFYGNHIPFRFDSLNGVTAVAQNNWWPSGYDYTAYQAYMSDSYFGVDPGFVNISNGDYNLESNAEVLAKANTSLGNLPTAELYVDSTGQLISSSRSSASDLGAYELGAFKEDGGSETTVSTVENLRIINP